MLNRTTVVAEATDITRYHTLFELSPDVTSKVCYRINLDGVPCSATPCHRLWVHIFLKVYRNESMHVSAASLDENTFRKWYWRMIDALSLLVKRLVSWTKWPNINKNQLGDMGHNPNSLSKQVLWENRYSLNWLVHVLFDGTDFRIEDPTLLSSLWFSHKFKASAITYEVVVSIDSGDIVHINGPFYAGDWPTIVIFRDGLIGMLDEGEKGEVDAGY